MKSRGLDVAKHLRDVLAAQAASPIGSYKPGESKKARWKRRRKEKRGDLAIARPGYSAYKMTGNVAVGMTAKQLAQRAARFVTPISGLPKMNVQGYECTLILRVTNPGLRQRFERIVGRIGNVKELWHGTKAVNALQIAEEGLRPGCGGMFGGGIYLGPFAKAWNYGSGSSAVVLLLKVRVALGRTWAAFDAWNGGSGQVLWQNGFHSIAGMCGRTKSWGGTLKGDEFVVYDPKQVLVTEIWEFRRNHVPASGT